MRPIIKKIDEIYSKASLEKQKKRFSTLKEGFSEYFGDHGELRFFSTPGTTEICGNHTEQNCGKVFAASVDLDIIAAAEPTDDGFVTIKSEGLPEDKIDLNDLEVHESDQNCSSGIIRGVLNDFRQNGHKIGGFRAYTTSTLFRGSGLGSAAAFGVLTGIILSHLYNEGQLRPVTLAAASKYAEENYFQRPCGLTRAISCASGGFTAIDFKDGDTPIVEDIPCNFSEFEHALCIIEVTDAPRLDLSALYKEIENEMHEVASYFDCENLRSLSLDDVMLNIGDLRKNYGDRAVLRAIHFFCENNRVEKVSHALLKNRFEDFLSSVRESGHSSFKYLQNVYSPNDLRNQSLSVALNAAEIALHRRGVCRVHGGGFEGTIQAFVPLDDITQFKMYMDKIFGIGSCHIMTVRTVGTCEVVDS
ncbi:MAG: galactokinase [Oscillospiraceae bacterium]|nr:galactokinase [Oscillospiraceae bacterium]